MGTSAIAGFGRARETSPDERMRDAAAASAADAIASAQIGYTAAGPALSIAPGIGLALRRPAQTIRLDRAGETGRMARGRGSANSATGRRAARFARGRSPARDRIAKAETAANEPPRPGVAGCPRGVVSSSSARERQRHDLASLGGEVHRVEELHRVARPAAVDQGQDPGPRSPRGCRAARRHRRAGGSGRWRCSGRTAAARTPRSSRRRGPAPPCRRSRAGSCPSEPVIRYCIIEPRPGSGSSYVIQTWAIAPLLKR